MDKLPKPAKQTLRKASRDAVGESFSFLRRHFKHGRWIGTGNRYRQNTTDRIEADTRSGGALDHFHLTQYIAASAPLHCADGWSLLGRALDCHARRDHDSARHFAYYAELRAAISVLAAEGIAIFDRDHFVVEKLKRCTKFGGRTGTHILTWQALEYWAQLKRSSDLLGKSIRVDGHPLAEWLEHFPGSGSLRAIGSRWLKMWGLDLRIFSDDRNTRNEASYRPTKLTERGALNVEDSADFMCALWSLCEPTAQAPFGILDRHLLRLALEETFLGVRGTTAATDAEQYKNDVESMLPHITSDTSAQQRWIVFLTRKTEPGNPIIFSEARGTDGIDAPRQHLQMISRAALLLRVASAASSRLLQETDISSRDVKFWWSAIGEERGLWEKANQPANLTDLWADADAAVKNITGWRTQTPAASRVLAKWRQERSYDISVLGGCERIALWGLGL